MILLNEVHRSPFEADCSLIEGINAVLFLLNL
jgi:hypothetical protein